MAESGLDEALAEHLAALDRKDLEAYAATLADEVVLILPDGQVLAGKPAVVELHRQLFADGSWTQERTVRTVTTVGSTGWVLIEYRFFTVDADGRIVSDTNAYFTLTYAHVDGRWLVVADQNTRKAPAAAQ
ncbi:YybH family protein [Dactylosporangium sucinum]|uniref:YybH family protein n=1 Tax=Dactylosporangium sucinum TaxID=1424081 RepID=UPI00167CBA3A|nr:SgcJ/EcaC family oxidoreductase [Dactylosporangium sucinum]